MKITIDCTEEQARLIEKSLEIVFRSLMNQWGDLSDMLASDTYTYDKTNPKNDKLFDDFLIRRDSIRAVLEAVGKISYGEYYSKSSDLARNISDIWSCLRNALYNADDTIDKNYYDTRRYNPIQLGTIELPKIEVANE